MVDVAEKYGGDNAYIGVLSVHTRDKIVEYMFFFVFVWNKDNIGVKGALVELEAGFVCNPVPVSECRSGRRISGHIMDESMGKTR